jgi:predicted Zn-dependent protease with MMP-like domain
MKFTSLAELARRTVSATQGRLPEPIRELARAVPVFIERKPSEDIVHEGIETDVLGLFSGSAHGTDNGDDLPMPPQIFLYLESIWDLAEGDEKIFADEVRLTYLHELGHYLGWDEEDLAARGLD